jgi:hypothetical protein
MIVAFNATLFQLAHVKRNPELFWLTDTSFHDEAEEEIFDDVIDIGDHLIKVVSGLRTVAA